MDRQMDLMTGKDRSGGSQRLPAWLSGLLVVVVSFAIAAPAQATPNVAKAWGANSRGELGDGTTTGPEECGVKEACSTTPVNVSGLSGVVAVAASDTTFSPFSMALLEGGAVEAWGDGLPGDLGNGSDESSDVPAPVCARGETAPCAKGLTGARAIAAGEEVGMALLNEKGTVMAWGYGGWGQLGDGGVASSTTPVAVCAAGLEAPCPTGPYLSGVKAIAAGTTFGLALLEDGKVMAWGHNSSGQLGNGSEEGPDSNGYDTPVEVSGLSEEATAIAAGENRGLALLKSGKVMAWGQGVESGKTVIHDTPVEVTGLGEEATAIAAGAQHSLALLKSGKVMSWGSNEAGQLGDGSPVPESGTPQPVCAAGTTGPCLTGPYLGGVSSISASGRESLALLASGGVVAWGANSSGQLGDGTSTGPEVCSKGPCSRVPVPVSGISGARGIAAGSNASLAFGPPPTVTAVKPRKGPASGGTTVIITGTDLTGATEVKFGSVNALSFTVNSATSITAVAPAAPAGKVDVTVTNTWGTSAISLADRFTFTPTVTGLSPNSGPSAGGTSVTVTGSGFALGTTATKFHFGRAKATSVNCTSTTTCTVVSPAHEVGTVDVKATVNKISSPRSRPSDQFTYS
jgi:alpha-tubulin suppressor-like RCC1 family protein